MPGGPYPNQTGSVTTFTSTTGVKADQFDFVVNGCTHRAIVPWSAGPGTPMVWGIHGLGNDRNIITSGNIGANGMTDSWINAGLIVIGTETPQAASWGNDAARDTHALVFAWARGIWTQTPGPCLYGVSMGGMMCANYALEAKQQGLPITAIATNSAVLSLAAGYSIQSSSMNTDYGLTPGTDTPPNNGAWLTKTAGHDPKIVPISDFPDVPWRMYASSGDGTANKAANSDTFEARLLAAWGASVQGTAHEHTVVACTGDHASADQFRPADTLAFYQRFLSTYAPYTKYRLYVAGQYTPVVATENVKEAGTVQPLVWSPTIPTARPDEYVRPQL